MGEERHHPGLRQERDRLQPLLREGRGGRRGVQLPHQPCQVTTGCPVCLVLKQGAVNQLFLEVFLMFLACLDHSRWAKFHLGILGPQE